MIHAGHFGMVTLVEPSLSITPPESPNTGGVPPLTSLIHKSFTGAYVNLRISGAAPLVDHLIGHHRGRHRRVEAVGLAQHRHFDEQVALVLIGLRKSSLLVADQDE